MRTRLFTAVGVFSLVALCGLSTAQQGEPDLKGKTAKEAFKNIKVLKNMPADQLIPTMRKFNASLHVNCGFCHVRKPDHTGWELDDKPEKNMARKMIIMTEKLNHNERILDGHATCYMCHHGHPEPETEAPAEEERH
jgi:hypothetical protein